GYGTYRASSLWAARRAAPEVQAARPELEWLRQEFDIGDAQFTEVQRLEREYAPRCAQLCARVRESQLHLTQLVAAGTTPGPELEAAVADCARVEAECRNS